MSTNPPPYPPQPPYQPQQQYQPQQPYPPGYPPYPVKKKTSPLVWILLGLGIFFALLIMVGVGAVFFAVHKAKQAGLDPDLVKRNPALAAVKVMAALNPDIEVLSLNEQKGLVTVRDKKSGKTYNVDFDDAKRGKFVFEEEGKPPVTITSKNNGDGTIEVNSADGSLKIGGGKAKVPAWVPDYPGSDPQGAFSAQNAEGSSGSYAFKTSDPVEKVSKFFQDGFRSEGMNVTDTVTNQDGHGQNAMIKAEQAPKTALVLVGTENGTTNVSVTFTVKK